MSGMSSDDTTTADVGRTRRVRQLGKRISEARRLRGLVRDPDLQAVEMERRSRKTLVGLWFFLSLGLIYTTEGVHAFLAEGSTTADPLWWAAWTVEPMFAGLLITLLNFESVILSYGVAPNHDWWNRLKHVLLASTLAMNVIPQIAPLLQGRWATFNLGSLAVHAIIPVIVYGIAEVIPVIQARQREIVLMVYDRADEHEKRHDIPMPAAEPEPSAPDPEPVEQQPAAESVDAVRDVEPSSDPVTEPNLASASVVEPRKVSGVRLPADVLDRISRAVDQVRQEGRTPTVADVRAVARVPESLAERILADLEPIPA